MKINCIGGLGYEDIEAGDFVYLIHKREAFYRVEWTDHKRITLASNKTGKITHDNIPIEDAGISAVKKGPKADIWST